MADAIGSDRPRFYRRGSFWRKLAAIVAGFFILYLLIGFFVLPWIVKGQLESRLETTTGREVTVEEVGFNPLLLKLSVESFAIAGAEFPGEPASETQPPLAAFDRLIIDASVRSIWRLAPVLQLIRLERPVAHVARLSDGELNVADIIERISRREEPEEADEGLPGFWIDRVEIVEGAVEVRDASVEPLFVHRTDPINVALVDLGSLSEDAGEGRLQAQLAEGAQFEWSGDLRLDPLGSTGRIVLESIRIEPFHPYFENVAAVNLGSSRMSLDLAYTLNPGPDQELLTLTDGSVRLDAIEVAGRDDPADPFLRLQTLEVVGIGLRLSDRNVSVDAVRLHDGGLRVERAEDGSISLLELMPPSDEGSSGTTAAGASAPEGATPWTFAVGRVALEQFALEYQDASFANPFVFGFNLDALTLQGITDALDEPVVLALQGDFGGRGGLQVEGPVTLAPLQAELDIGLQGLPLEPFAAVAASFASVGELSGAASFEGRVVVEPSTGNGVLNASVNGQAVLAGLGLVESIEGQRILEVDTVSIDGIDARANPLGVAVAEVAVVKPQVLVVRMDDGDLNWLKMIAATGAADETEAAPTTADAPAREETASDAGAAETETAEAESTDTASPPLPLELAVLRVEEGRIHFRDRSVDPVVDESVENLNVTVNDFALVGDAPVRLQLDAMLRDGSRFTGQGEWLAADFAQAAELGLNLQAFRLPPLSPYSAKFIGREIASGALALDMRYAVRDAQLDGHQSITLSQFELGQDVPSEGALDLPIGLAVSLLRDRNGTIQLDVPISGDLNDPQFDIVSVISSAFGNIVQRAATAPFRMLGSVFGGGDGAEDADLSFVSFAAGSAELDEANRSKLGTLARALYERPALSLRYRALPLSEEDRQQLARQHLREQLLRPATGQNDQSPDLGEIAATSDEAYRAAVEGSYRQRLNPAPPAATAPASTDSGETGVAASEEPESPRESEIARSPARPVGGFASSSRRSAARFGARQREAAEEPTEPASPETTDEPVTVTARASEPASEPRATANQEPASGADVAGDAGTVPFEEMEAELLAEVEVPEAAARELRALRERTVREYLLQAQDIEPERIGPVEGEATAQPPAESEAPAGAVIFEVG